MDPWAMAGAQAAHAAGQAARTAPAISGGGPNMNKVSIGAPTFTTRATGASAASMFMQQLPVIAGVGAAGLAVWLIAR